MPVCAQCGASMGPRQGWCSLCLSPVEVPRSGPPVREPPQWSRVQGGVTSFGLGGRIIATVVALLPPVLLYRTGGLFALAFGIMWYVFAVPLVLNDVWKRERIR